MRFCRQRCSVFIWCRWLPWARRIWLPGKSARGSWTSNYLLLGIHWCLLPPHWFRFRSKAVSYNWHSSCVALAWPTFSTHRDAVDLQPTCMAYITYYAGLWKRFDTASPWQSIKSLQSACPSAPGIVVLETTFLPSPICQIVDLHFPQEPIL